MIPLLVAALCPVPAPAGGDIAAVQLQKLQASDLSPGDDFGISVALDGDTAVVGAWLADSPQAAAGAAYVYELTVDTWNEVAHLVQGGSNLAGHRFGNSVAISGATPSIPDRLLVGSPSRQGWAHGSVHSYTRTNGTWTARTILEAPTPSATDGWACALALDGDWAAIGQCDSDAQASLHEGCRTSGVRFLELFPHADTVALDQVLQRADQAGCRGKLVVTAGMFGLHGRVAPLPALLAVCRERGIGDWA